MNSISFYNQSPVYKNPIQKTKLNNNDTFNTKNTQSAKNNALSYPKNYRPYFGSKYETKSNSTISPTDVNAEDIEDFEINFIQNNELENVLKNHNFSIYNDGLPLKYSRQDFLFDLNNILDTLPKDRQDEIYQKLEIKPVKISGENPGYDGIINLENLDKDDETERKVYEISHKFIKENEIQTDDEDVNKILNSIIKAMPEFINIIGKKQHKDHPFTLDIHILNAVISATRNYDYENLEPDDKECLKYAILMHDIAKPENINDGKHPENSALYAEKILEKYPLDDDKKERICEMIKNHHWLQDLNECTKDEKQIAKMMKNKTNWKMAQIFAEADLRASGGKLLMLYGRALSDYRRFSIIEKEIENLQNRE